MDLNLKGKKAFITGGSRGIGKAIAEALIKEGVDVHIGSRTRPNVKKAKWIRVDFDKEIVVGSLEDIDILINNVGGLGTAGYDLSNLCMHKNFDITKQLTNKFIDEGHIWGRVITVSSIYGKEKGHNPYFTAAKAAQIAYMKSLAGEYRGTTFNTICPGHIDVGKEFPDKPKVIGKPQDVANLVVFLCSEKARHINGACITVDGGESHSF